MRELPQERRRHARAPGSAVDARLAPRAWSRGAEQAVPEAVGHAEVAVSSVPAPPSGARRWKRGLTSTRAQRPVAPAQPGVRQAVERDLDPHAGQPGPQAGTPSSRPGTNCASPRTNTSPRGSGSWPARVISALRVVDAVERPRARGWRASPGASSRARRPSRPRPRRTARHQGRWRSQVEAAGRARARPTSPFSQPVQRARRPGTRRCRPRRTRCRWRRCAARRWRCAGASPRPKRSRAPTPSAASGGQRAAQHLRRQPDRSHAGQHGERDLQGFVHRAARRGAPSLARIPRRAAPIIRPRAPTAADPALLRLPRAVRGAGGQGAVPDALGARAAAAGAGAELARPLGGPLPLHRPRRLLRLRRLPPAAGLDACGPACAASASSRAARSARTPAARAAWPSTSRGRTRAACASWPWATRSPSAKAWTTPRPIRNGCRSCWAAARRS